LLDGSGQVVFDEYSRSDFASHYYEPDNSIYVFGGSKDGHSLNELLRL